MSKCDILVVGARPGSLGDAVRLEAVRAGLIVTTAGITSEQWRCDATSDDTIRVLAETLPEHVVCTVGMNRRAGANTLVTDMMDHYLTNVIAPMRLLRDWLEYLRSYVRRPDAAYRHFVAVSSNSTHIARRNSLPYCSSKAALSMAIRCAARDVATQDGVLIWAVEPGLMRTGMTDETARQFEGALHRIPGLSSREGLSPTHVARHIVSGIINGGTELNGATLRLDGGEQ